MLLIILAPTLFLIPALLFQWVAGRHLCSVSHEQIYEASEWLAEPQGLSDFMDDHKRRAFGGWGKEAIEVGLW